MFIWEDETVKQGNKHKTIPQKQALMIPVGPQIQAQYQSHKGAWNMGHRSCVMEPMLAMLRAGGSIDLYDDVYCSSILLDVLNKGILHLMMLSWCFWSMVCSSIRANNLTVGFISGFWWTSHLSCATTISMSYLAVLSLVPTSPRTWTISCTQGFTILWCCRKDSLCIWDCQMGHIFTSHLYLFFLGSANGPGLAVLHG